MMAQAMAQGCSAGGGLGSRQDGDAFYRVKSLLALSRLSPWCPKRSSFAVFLFWGMCSQ